MILEVNNGIPKKQMINKVLLISILFLFFIGFTSASLFGYNSPSNAVTIGGNKTTYINNSYFNLTSGGVTNASSITCGGTDKISAYSNATGLFTCTTDDTSATGISSAIVNSTINQYLNNANASYLSTYNATYHTWAFNQTLNLDQTYWFNQTANLVFSGDNSSWNESYADTLYTNKTGYNTTQFQTVAGMIHIIDSWITGLIESIGLSLGFNNTFNSTYDSYSTNVSKNWTLITNGTYGVWWFNQTANLVFSGDNSSWNESLAHTLFDSTFNATYASYTTNVSRNWTLDAYNAWNTVWSSTYNATYAGYFTFNATSLLTNLTATDCGAGTLVIGINSNGSVLCASDANSGGSNFFNQQLNTTSNTTFYNITATNDLTAKNIYTNQNITTTSWFHGLFDWVTGLFGVGSTNSKYLLWNGTTLGFNETNMNTTISFVSNKSINWFLNSTINQYFTQANASYPVKWNASILQYQIGMNLSQNLSLNQYNTSLTNMINANNKTVNIQRLINNTNLNLTELTIGKNITMFSNQSIRINTNKVITSNDTCLILKGAVSTLQIC